MNKLFSVLALSILAGAAFGQRGYNRNIIVRSSPVIVHRSPMIVNRAPVIISRPPVIINRAPVIVSRPPVIVSRPPVYYPYHNISFRFSAGYFYRPYGNYWRVVPPPIGLRVSGLPYGYTPMYMGPSLFYYSNGAYYRRYDDHSYEVVDPPMGATLSSLPGGAKSVLINGEQFYELNGTYYKKTTNEKGKTVYVVSGKNGEINNSASSDQEAFTPHPGDVIDQLPEDYKTVTLNGQTYYVSPDDTYYQSFEQDGVTRYEIVATPNTDIKD